jgi:hypothetical protein
MKEETMTDDEIGSLAKKYVDESVAAGGASPSGQAYDAAIAKIEAETRKLLAVSGGRSADRETVAC